MKSLTKLFTAATFAVATVVLPLQTFAAEKIGTVDMRAILTTSPQAKSVSEKLKNEFKAREEKIVAANKSFQEKSEKLQRNAAVMSETEKNKLEKEIMAQQRELQRLQDDFQADARIRQQEETKKLVDKINGVIQEVAKKENYDLIIHSDAAPFANKQVDITDKVIKAIAAKG